MSVQAISWALSLRGIPGVEKSVLIALCNYADAQGDHCFPGQERLAADTGWSLRAVRDALRKLEMRGLISRAGRRRQDGIKTSDEITVKLSAAPRAARLSAAPHYDLSGTSRQGQRQEVPVHIDEPSENRQRTVSYSSRKTKKGSSGKEDVAEILTKVLTPEIAEAVVEHRNAMRRKLTPHGAKLLVLEFVKWGNPIEAANEMIARGWQGFKAAWMDRERGPTTAKQRAADNVREITRQMIQEGRDKDAKRH